jgi:hypothetical protein
VAPDLYWSLWESFILGEFVEILPELGRLVPLAEDVNAGLDAKEKKLKIQFLLRMYNVWQSINLRKGLKRGTDSKRIGNCNVSNP